jgi:hypothetical protein
MYVGKWVCFNMPSIIIIGSMSNKPRTRPPHPARSFGVDIIRRGGSNADVAKACGVSETTAARWRREVGVTPLPRGARAGVSPQLQRVASPTHAPDPVGTIARGGGSPLSLLVAAAEVAAVFSHGPGSEGKLPSGKPQRALAPGRAPGYPTAYPSPAFGGPFLQLHGRRRRTPVYAQSWSPSHEIPEDAGVVVVTEIQAHEGDRDVFPLLHFEASGT